MEESRQVLVMVSFATSRASSNTPSVKHADFGVHVSVEGMCLECDRTSYSTHQENEEGQKRRSSGGPFRPGRMVLSCLPLGQ